MRKKILLLHFLIFFLFGHRPAHSQPLKKILSKSTYDTEDSITRILSKEVYDTQGRTTLEITFTYSGKSLYSTEKKYHYYSESVDSSIWLDLYGKDSVQTLRLLEHKEKGHKVNAEYFEKVYGKPAYSWADFSFSKTKTDSIVYERWHLYNGDTTTHIYHFSKKMLVSHRISTNGKLVSESTNGYDAKGRLLTTTNSEATWETSSTENFEYNAKGVKTKSTHQTHFKDGQTTVSVYYYDDKGNETYSEERTAISTFKISNTYIYENGLLTEKDETSGSSLGKSMLRIFTYRYEFYP